MSLRFIILAWALVLQLLSTAQAQQPPWSNWDQEKAFAESQKRLAAGKDPLPGQRDCFWRYGPVSADPYINIAYPDGATFYWSAVFSIPDGARMYIEADYPKARYSSFITYDYMGAPLDAVADYLFKPVSGSVNPYLPGVSRDASNRRYRLEVVSTPLGRPIPWGTYMKGQTREQIHAPPQPNNGQQTLMYRIYAGDRGTDETAGAGLPKIFMTTKEGKMLGGREACAALRTAQPVSLDQGALATPRDFLYKLTEQARERMGPMAPATNPPNWSKSSEDMSRYAIYTGETRVATGEQKRVGSFYANLDNQYLRAFLHRKFGEVFVLRAKAPTTPKTYAGGGVWNDNADLRYWSWCSQQGFGSGRVNTCLFDEQIPVDRQGFYTLVVSNAKDRPRNAIPECGVAWLPIADVGDGTGEADMGFIVLRHMLGANQFPQAIQGVKSQSSIQQDMGPYAPRGRYTTVASFEAFSPCLIEQR